MAKKIKKVARADRCGGHNLPILSDARAFEFMGASLNS